MPINIVPLALFAIAWNPSITVTKLAPPKTPTNICFNVLLPFMFTSS